MNIDPNEWYKQSEYDLQTASSMFETGRYIYCVFMCHLSIEKSMKGLFVEKLGSLPPKSHNLVYFLDKLELIPDKGVDEFLTVLNDQGVATRYPESLETLISLFTKERTESIIKQAKDTLKWIRSHSKIL